MKKMCYILLAMLFVFGSVVMCGADSISTSATSIGYDDDKLGWVTDYYGYSFVIEDDISNDNLFHATLTNTSTGYDPLIDAFAFNIDATLSTDFSIANAVPATWSITVPTGGGIQFDYIGDTSDQNDRLHRLEALIFDFVFDEGYDFPDDPFTLWTGTDESFGTGLGGGDDEGQVAVHFQRLGYNSDGDLMYDSEGSDLLASNWEGGGGPQYVIPEPATMLLLGSGLIGFAVSGKKRFKRRNG